MTDWGLPVARFGDHSGPSRSASVPLATRLWLPLGVLIAEIPYGGFHRAIKASPYGPLGRPPLPGSARASTKTPPASPWTGTIAGRSKAKTCRGDESRSNPTPIRGRGLPRLEVACSQIGHDCSVGVHPGSITRGLRGRQRHFG